MKRALWISGLVVVSMLLVSFTAFPTTYTYAVRELSQTFSAIQTFSKGATFTTTTQAPNSIGVSLKYDADTSCWQEWKDNTLGWQFCDAFVVPPPCSASITLMPLGGQCRNIATGEIFMNTAGGIVALSGVPQ